MRGHIRKRGSRWAVVVDVGRDQDGKRQRKWHSGFERRRDAERALAEILRGLDSGGYVEPAKLSFGEYLTERWLPARKPSLKPTTFAGYSWYVGRIADKLGHLPLQRLAPDALSRFYAQQLASGGRGEKPLSARSVRYMHSIIHKALADAERWGLVIRNVAAAAEPPSSAAAKAAPPKTWGADELRAFLAAIREDRLYGLWLTYATTGLRRGEALGIQRGALDLDAAQLAVRSEIVTVRGAIHRDIPKSARGLRAVALDKLTVTALRAHLKRQAAERLAWGPAYQASGLVFCREDGSPLHPDTVSKRFVQLVGGLDVPRITLHGLRHTWASLALQASVNPKVVSERLGHATVAFTLDTYSHVMPGMQEDAAAKVAALLD